MSNTLIISLTATIAMIAVLFFLPAVIELKKPKDAGPRIINDNPTKIMLSMLKIPIIDIEEGQKLIYQSTIKNAAFLYNIQSIEF